MYTEANTAILTQLLTMAGVLPVAGENMEYDPILGTPYMDVAILHGQGEPISLGPNGYDRYYGVFQVLLKYPKGEGTAASASMATLLKNRFKRGTSMVESGVTVRVNSNGLGPNIPDRQWDIRPFSVNFFIDSQVI